jgi:hypothetical protein
MMFTMAVEPATSYGRCPCGGIFEQRTVEIRMTVAEEQVVLSDVMQGACPDCGSRVYKAATLQAIEDVMRGRPPR